MERKEKEKYVVKEKTKEWNERKINNKFREEIKR